MKRWTDMIRISGALKAVAAALNAARYGRSGRALDATPTCLDMPKQNIPDLNSQAIKSPNKL